MFNGHIKLLISILLTTLSLAVAGGNVTASPIQAKSTEKYCVLSKDKPLLEQLNQKNTAYEIRYDFDLKKASLTIPEGSELVFMGGKLKNGTVNLNNCYIEGNAVFDCYITGCPSNEVIYTKWFTKADVELFVLLRNFCSCWYDDKSQVITHKNKRIIHIEKST